MESLRDFDALRDLVLHQQQELAVYQSHLEVLIEERTQEVRESEERFRLFAEVSFEAILIHYQGVILDINCQWMSLHGFTNRDEVIGKHISDLVFDQHKYPRSPDVAGALELIEVEHQDVHGNKLLLLTRGRPCRYQGKDCWVVVFRPKNGWVV